MDLRPELSPPVVPGARIERLCAAIHTVEALLQSNADASVQIAAFNADTGHAYAPHDFVTYSSHRDVEAFALEAARPVYPKVPDISRDELVEIVRRIHALDAETDYYLLLLETNTVRPGVSDLIHWPPPELVDASAEAIVDEALRYRPIVL